MKTSSKWHFRFLRFLIIAIMCAAAVAMSSVTNLVLAEEVTVVVIEKDGKGANTVANRKNLPDGAKSTEASSVKDAVDKTMKLLGDDDCLKNLHFRGHGKQGVQGVGDGTGMEEGKHINSDTAWKEELEKLKFCDDATVHLWGCHVGACKIGAAKLKEIADTLNVTAKGIVDSVYAGEQENYDGDFQTATPDEPQPECKESGEIEKAPKKSEGESEVTDITSIIFLILL